jgi:hypothetical protein
MNPIAPRSCIPIPALPGVRFPAAIFKAVRLPNASIRRRKHARRADGLRPPFRPVDGVQTCFPSASNGERLAKSRRFSRRETWHPRIPLLPVVDTAVHCYDRGRCCESSGTGRRLKGKGTVEGLRGVISLGRLDETNNGAPETVESGARGVRQRKTQRFAVKSADRRAKKCGLWRAVGRGDAVLECTTDFQVRRTGEKFGNEHRSRSERGRSFRGAKGDDFSRSEKGVAMGSVIRQ